MFEAPHAAAILTLKDKKPRKKKGKMETCDCCGKKVRNIIGCPDGQEICQSCFDNGEG